jgi:ribose/xylose/arabinose/galactoside ABC-type transport system permease subunit
MPHSSASMPSVSRLLITLGTLFLVAGLAWRWLRHLPLFRLPGDVVIDRPGFKFFFPITTLLIVSAVLSILAWLLRR